MISQRDQTRRRRLPRPSVRPPQASQPAPTTPCSCLVDGRPKDDHGAEPPSADELAQVAVDPRRFVHAARAAFESGRSCPCPHTAVLLILKACLDAPTATGLSDPLAPTVLALAKVIYGENRTYWENATTAFRHCYRQASDAKPEANSREADAAVLRWRVLLSLVQDDPNFWRDWLRWQPLRLHAHYPPFQARYRAVAMVYTAAGMTLWRDDSRPPTSDKRHVLAVDRLMAETKAVEATIGDLGVDDHFLRVIWDGLFDERLDASRWALSATAQQFLAFVLTRAGLSDASPAEAHRMCADALADWAQMDPQAVRAAFARSDVGNSPAHELFVRRAVLPDWRWAGLAGADPLCLPWLDAPPRGGQQNGCPWLEVTVGRELWPYLRRLWLYLDRMPLAASEE